MTYTVMLNIDGKTIPVKDYFLDGIIDNNLLLRTRLDYVIRSGRCDACYGKINHIISNDITPKGRTNLFCPPLFHKIVKPKWKLEQVAGFKTNTVLSKGHFVKRIRIGDDDDFED